MEPGSLGFKKACPGVQRGKGNPSALVKATLPHLGTKEKPDLSVLCRFKNNGDTGYNPKAVNR